MSKGDVIMKKYQIPMLSIEHIIPNSNIASTTGECYIVWGPGVNLNSTEAQNLINSGFQNGRNEAMLNDCNKEEWSISWFY